MISFPDYDKWLFIDVDDTLIEWVDQNNPRLDHSEEWFSIPGKEPYVFFPIKGNIEKLKRHKSKGHGVIVWTQGGAAWADTIVRKLGVEAYVDACMGKPTTVVDDLPLHLWFPKIVYFGPVHLCRESE